MIRSTKEQFYNNARIPYGLIERKDIVGQVMLSGRHYDADPAVYRQNVKDRDEWSLPHQLAELADTHLFKIIRDQNTFSQLHATDQSLLPENWKVRNEQVQDNISIDTQILVPWTDINQVLRAVEARFNFVANKAGLRDVKTRMQDTLNLHIVKLSEERIATVSAVWESGHYNGVAYRLILSVESSHSSEVVPAVAETVTPTELLPEAVPSTSTSGNENVSTPGDVNIQWIKTLIEMEEINKKIRALDAAIQYFQSLVPQNAS